MGARGKKSKSGLPAVIKVAVVDDQKLFRSGIISLLKEYDDLNVVIEAVHGRDLLEQMKRQTPHVVLLDIEMPEMNGIETALVLKEKYPQVKFIILTLHNEEEFIFDLVKKGAHGYIPKDKSVEEVIDAIYGVMENGTYYGEEITLALLNGRNGLVKDLRMASLSEKETDIVRYICQEKTNKEIAQLLGISTRTLEGYRALINEKTCSKNTAGLVLYALKYKIISKLGML